MYQLLQHLQANFFRNAKLFYVENPAIQPFLVKFEEQDPEVRRMSYYCRFELACVCMSRVA